MRRAVDTNILVRLLARDHSEQWKRASQLLDDGSMVVASTVILETEWVLRSVLGYDKQVVGNLLTRLLALPNIELIEEDRMTPAVSLHQEGMDFADALHLTGAQGADEFLTFDRDLVRRAKRAQIAVPVRLA